MNKEIKKFIEKHVDLLDSDPVEFFYQTWLNYTLQRSDIAYMSTMLSEAGIKDVEYPEDVVGVIVQIHLTSRSDVAHGIDGRRQLRRKQAESPEEHQ